MFRKTRVASFLIALLFTFVTVPDTWAVYYSEFAAPPLPVWFSDKLGVHQIDANTNTASLNLIPDRVIAIGANSRDNTAWSLSATALTKYDINGNTLVTIPLAIQTCTRGQKRIRGFDEEDDFIEHGKDKSSKGKSSKGIRATRPTGRGFPDADR